MKITLLVGLWVVCLSVSASASMQTTKAAEQCTLFLSNPEFAASQAAWAGLPDKTRADMVYRAAMNAQTLLDRIKAMKPAGPWDETDLITQGLLHSPEMRGDQQIQSFMLNKIISGAPDDAWAALKILAAIGPTYEHVRVELVEMVRSGKYRQILRVQNWEEDTQAAKIFLDVLVKALAGKSELLEAVRMVSAGLWHGDHARENLDLLLFILKSEYPYLAAEGFKNLSGSATEYILSVCLKPLLARSEDEALVLFTVNSLGELAKANQRAFSDEGQRWHALLELMDLVAAPLARSSLGIQYPQDTTSKSQKDAIRILNAYGFKTTLFFFSEGMGSKVRELIYEPDLDAARSASEPKIISSSDQYYVGPGQGLRVYGAYGSAFPGKYKELRSRYRFLDHLARSNALIMERIMGSPIPPAALVGDEGL